MPSSLPASLTTSLTSLTPLISSALTSAQNHLVPNHPSSDSVDGSLHGPRSVRSDEGTAATVQEFVGIVTRVLSAINAFLDFVYYTVQLTVFLSCLFVASSLTYHLIYKLLIPTDIYASSVPLIYSNASAFGLLDFSSLSAPAPSLSFYCSNPHTVAILNL
ncbi:hypothetical protein TeGR_g9014, partial [Tetraparma gracilis]